MAILNGRLPATMLKVIKSHTNAFGVTRRVRPAAANSFDRLDAAFYKEFGKHIYITDSYRTYAEQVAVKNAKGFLAAKPGTSEHGWGLALDLGSRINIRSSAEHRWMRENGPEYGWFNPAWAVPGALGFQKDEPWHFEYVQKSDKVRKRILAARRAKRLAIIPTFNKAVQTEWQKQLGGLKTDGVFGAGSATRLRARINAKDGRGGFDISGDLKGDGPLNERDIKAVQKLLNVWAKRKAISLTRPLKVTGKMDGRTKMALRKSLNEGLWK